MKNQINCHMIFEKLILIISILSFSNKLTAMESKFTDSAIMESKNSDSDDEAPKSFNFVDFLTTTYESTSQSNSRNNSRPSSPVAVYKSTEATHDNWGQIQENKEPFPILWSRGDEPHSMPYPVGTREIRIEHVLEEIIFSPESYAPNNETLPTQDQSDSKQETMIIPTIKMI